VKTFLTVFLDANILFSASYKPANRLQDLWKSDRLALVTSLYAVEEARRNLPSLEQRETLERLLRDLRVLFEVPVHERFPDVAIPEKDLPIFLGALHARADVLLTGDVRHFGAFFGKTIRGLLILDPRSFFVRFLTRG